MKIHTDRVPRPLSEELQWVMDQFFALYFLEFPFNSSNPPKFNRDSVKDFLQDLKEIEQELWELENETI